MLKFKEDVRMGAKNFNSHSIRILEAVESTAPQGYTPTVTSASDSVHGDTSLHPSGMAYDFRVKDYPTVVRTRYDVIFKDDEEAWADRIRNKLGDDYDVLVHGEGDNRHMHIEYDPKTI